MAVHTWQNFSQAFRHIGLVPDGGAAYLLTRTVGRVRAMELMLLGEKLPAGKALDWGLITRVVADDAVDAHAHRIAAELAAGPRLALAMIRRANRLAVGCCRVLTILLVSHFR